MGENQEIVRKDLRRVRKNRDFGFIDEIIELSHSKR